MIMNVFLRRMSVFGFMAVLISFGAAIDGIGAAEPPVVRIAHGAFSEKIAIMWVGAEQGIFRKNGSTSK
jgi:hypothetical protein